MSWEDRGACRGNGGISRYMRRSAGKLHKGE